MENKKGKESQPKRAVKISQYSHSRQGPIALMVEGRAMAPPKTGCFLHMTASFKVSEGFTPEHKLVKIVLWYGLVPGRFICGACGVSMQSVMQLVYSRLLVPFQRLGFQDQGLASFKTLLHDSASPFVKYKSKDGWTVYPWESLFLPKMELEREVGYVQGYIC